jgi:Ni,Fe-hydrogenase III large subunit
MARDIRGFVVPGADAARAAGLDLGGAGLHLSATPRHASVLIIIGPLPAGLADAASVAYAQMPRPRAIVALGAGDLAPLPEADVAEELTQIGLVAALAELKQVFATDSFQPEVHDYDAPPLKSRIEYTCPMHPEVVQDEPGNCPKCGMTLIPRETAESPHADHAKSADAQHKPMTSAHEHGKTAHAGHGEAHDPHDYDHAKHAAAEAPAQFTCPMHPEVVTDQPGSCTKCGMVLVPAKARDGHADHDKKETDHVAGQMDHGTHGSGEVIEGAEANFMSMVDMTRDMPASSDGLKMEWINVPFGPFFPGLPGGLQLDLTLDGDAVADAKAQSVVGRGALLSDVGTSPKGFIDAVEALSPLSPVAYRELACRAVERAAGHSVAPETARARAAALERERVASHLGWMAGFGAQSGFGWLENRAAALQLKIRAATIVEITELTPAIKTLIRRVQRTPLLKTKLTGIGRLTGDDTQSGPLARAGGIPRDARSDDPVYAALGFAVVTTAAGDALARLTQRCGEIAQSLELISRADAIVMPQLQGIGATSGTSQAIVETPRGAAQLSLTLHKGKVTSVDISTPTAAHVALIATVADGREIGDALTAIGSLDISPWEVTT